MDVVQKIKSNQMPKKVCFIICTACHQNWLCPINFVVWSLYGKKTDGMLLKD